MVADMIEYIQPIPGCRIRVIIAISAETLLHVWTGVLIILRADISRGTLLQEGLTPGASPLDF